MSTSQDRRGDAGGVLLYGADAIASYLGISLDATYRRIRQGAIPAFRMGAVMCARKPTLDAHFASLEAEQRAIDAQSPKAKRRPIR